jgi:hypothetical protein
MPWQSQLCDDWVEPFALLEIGILDIEGDDPVVIHAQPLRPKFHKFLR